MLPLEVAGAFLGMVNLWLTIRQNIWCWPVGIACVVCFGAVFIDARLYSDALLQLVYFGMQIYGWWFWVKLGHVGASSTGPVISLDRVALMKWALGIALVAAGLGSVMKHYTNADMPYMDALPTAISIAAAWLQARKVLQSWLLFISANLLFIAVYFSKGLYVSIGLYVLSTMLAVSGFQRWRKAHLHIHSTSGA
jgi:nicotinamide mononucleotide transporter